MIYTEGDGSELSPYHISTAEQLNQIRNNWNKHFVLVRDIDLVAEGIYNWVPIDGWEGYLDGYGHYIKNFNCYWTDRQVGMFSWLGTYATNPVVIKRLGIIGGKIGVGTNSNYYCGYITALFNGNKTTVTLEDIHVEGLVDPGGDRGSSLVGIIETGTIYLRRCVANVGSLNNGRASMAYHYSGSPQTTECYYRNDSSNQGGLGVGVSTSSFINESSFTGLNFVNTWEMVGGGPQLKKHNTGSVSGNVFDNFNVPTSRTVRAYDRTTGELLGQTVSNSADGYYSLALAKGVEVDLVCLDDTAGLVFNDLISRAIPV